MVDQRSSQNEPSLFTALRSMHEHWGWFLALGVVLVILGIVALGASVLTSLVTILFLGWIFVIGGVVKLLHAIWTRSWSGFFLTLAVGLLYGIVGVLILTKPVAALAALTLLVGLLFVVSGLFRIFSSLMVRFGHWGWVLFSGVISLLLGGMILSEWPQASLWVIGVFVGIDLIFAGWTWIIMALAAKRSLVV